MKSKRRHFFLVPYSSSGGNKWLEVGRALGRRKLIEPGIKANRTRIFVDLNPWQSVAGDPVMVVAKFSPTGKLISITVFRG